ncbi:MAG: DegT/DnrJ/EryC1/StrS family aminotransferase, partial [Deltaproteobacteria bacterium]|nr:DegT/DnrJ/EryC1/StrS family aminotransferase [Deltaproteobacteria bacterium]
LVLPESHPSHVYHHFVIRTERRDALKDFLSARQTDSEVYYPLALHLQPCFAQFGYQSGSLPRSEAASKEALALPVHPDLSEEQIDFVAETVRGFYRA